jgi:hypothetical protein
VRSQSLIQDISHSHIVGNTPDAKVFDSFLKRDIEKYFHNKYSKNIVATFNYLRIGATQSGVSYPKYYLWIRVNDGDSLYTEGAIRVAAIEKKYFEITDFVSKQDIIDKKVNIYLIFPKPVCEKIIEQLKQ